MTETAPTNEDLNGLFDEVQVLCGGLDNSLVDETAEIEDHFSDDELRELLTSVMVFIRSNEEPSEADRARITEEVRGKINMAIRKRKEPEAPLEEFSAESEEDAASGEIRDSPHASKSQRFDRNPRGTSRAPSRNRGARTGD